MNVIRTESRVTSGSRRGGALALVVAALLLVALLGSCSTDNSASDLAAQDKQVQLGNRLAAVHARVVQARRLVARQRRIAALLERRQRPAATPPVRSAVQSSVSLDRLCAPIPRGLGKASRLAARERERQRKRALYYLNLSCPAVRS